MKMNNATPMLEWKYKRTVIIDFYKNPGLFVLMIKVRVDDSTGFSGNEHFERMLMQYYC